MSKEGSVAPKERINIVYKTHSNGVEESVELPLKILVTGEFLSRDDNDVIENRKKINVNKNNFNDVMEAQELKLKLTVEDKMSTDEDSGELELDITIDSMKSFTPDSIVQSVPELKKMMELREALKALKAPLGNTPEFRKKIDAIVQNEDIKNKILEELKIEESE